MTICDLTFSPTYEYGKEHKFGIFIKDLPRTFGSIPTLAKFGPAGVDSVVLRSNIQND